MWFRQSCMFVSFTDYVLLYCGLTLMPGGTSLRGRAGAAGFSRGSMSLRGRAGEERELDPADWMLLPDVELRGRLRKSAVSAASLSSSGSECAPRLVGREPGDSAPAEKGCMPVELSVGEWWNSRTGERAGDTAEMGERGSASPLLRSSARQMNVCAAGLRIVEIAARASVSFSGDDFMNAYSSLRR